MADGNPTNKTRLVRARDIQVGDKIWSRGGFWMDVRSVTPGLLLTRVVPDTGLELVFFSGGNVEVW